LRLEESLYLCPPRHRDRDKDREREKEREKERQRESARERARARERQSLRLRGNPLASSIFCASDAFSSGSRQVTIRLPRKGNSNSHCARPVHQIEWIRNSSLSIRNSLSLQGLGLRRNPLASSISSAPDAFILRFRV